MLVLCACHHAPGEPTPAPTRPAPRLKAPSVIDPAVRGAAYLTAVAVQLQPGWGQFLDDCRLRLPGDHPLNRMQLAATVELAIARDGKLAGLVLATSGNRDFDRAVSDAIADAVPLPVPPVELLSDDDQLHLRWLFARDRRQAGPATASVVALELPVAGVVERLIGQGELARAALRVRAAPAADRDRAPATTRVMIAVLREAVARGDDAVRAAAVAAIGRAQVSALAAEVRALLAPTTATGLRVDAVAALGALGDRDAAPTLLAQLASDLREQPRLALAETRALVALGHQRDAAETIGHVLAADGATPHAGALEAYALAPAPELAGKLAGWFARGDTHTRAAVCLAATSAVVDPVLGLGDADATVRAVCCDAAAARALARPQTARRIVARLRELARDRDRGVRARAIGALQALDRDRAPRGLDDDAAEVRAAYAAALDGASAHAGDLAALADDRDAEVRAAAWLAIARAAQPPFDRAALAARAIADPAAAVRLAAAGVLADGEPLVRLAAADDSPDVRTAALVRIAALRGRAVVTDDLLDRVARAMPASGERVRAALAWLLAR